MSSHTFTDFLVTFRFRYVLSRSRFEFSGRKIAPVLVADVSDTFANNFIGL